VIDDPLDPLDGELTPKKIALYTQVIERIFHNHYRKGDKEFEFDREEIEEVARALHLEGSTTKAKSKNPGDVIYTFRHRKPLPNSILQTQPPDRSWIILGAGDARYRFRLNKLTHLIPTKGKKVIPIPDSTPEIIVKYTKRDDEQALLAKIRYNRLVDIFLGVTTYSVQNHLRTKIPNYGQIEIDELYVGVDKVGRHYVIPVQVKGVKDKLGVIQTIQDITYCRTAPELNRAGSPKGKKKDFSGLECRAVSAQLIRDGQDEVIAMFLSDFDGDEVVEVDQRHYSLVAAGAASPNP
jgi:hypothetical protein